MSSTSMSIATITRPIAILLAFLFSAAWAQSFEEGMTAYKEGNYETAFEVFQSLAEEGDAFAQFNVGAMYNNGEGVPADDSEAVRWYRAAAEQGHALAQFNLGIMYDNGEGVIQDYSEAVRWYRAAAEQGYAPAQTNLGLNYLLGEGVPESLVTAHMWLNIASANGNRGARDARSDVADLMSRETIDEAQSRARTCMESGYQDCD